MSSLDEILATVYDNGMFDEAGDRISPTSDEKSIAKAKAQIKAWVAEEIIGKTEVEPATPYGAVLAVQHRNALRDKQRKRLEEA